MRINTALIIDMRISTAIIIGIGIIPSAGEHLIGFIW
jgi:hypothetical protein